MRPGDLVTHEKFGRGKIVSRWGSLGVEKITLGGRKITTPIDCSEIYTVKFESGKLHSCRREYLTPYTK